MSVAPRQKARGLPAETTTFVGRRSEFARARRLLADTRMLTLTGVGGVGKTRLALKIATDVERGFSDGVWLVELADITDKHLIAPRIVDVLGGRLQRSSPVTALCEFLADRQLLLVLDNCEHLLEATAALAAQLLRAAPAVRILATSRQPLGIPGESIQDIPPMPVPGGQTQAGPGSLMRYDAVTLFVERAAALRPDFTLTDDNAEVVSRLCRSLEGIPLAIELAAVWLRSMSLEQILSRLDDQLGLLRMGRRAVHPRHQTLHAALDWSYQLCSPKEQLLWARLSVFSGSLDLKAAEDVCAGDGLDRPEILEMLSRLVDKSIIIRTADKGGPVRYRLLEILRQYGRQLLVQSGQERAVLRQHRDWYLHLAEEGEVASWSSRQAEWLIRLGKDRSNLRAAVEFSLAEPGGGRSALTIASAVFWVAVGGVTEVRHWLDQALAGAPEPSSARAKALWAKAWYGLLQGDQAEAGPALAECRQLALELGDDTALSWATEGEGQAALFRRDLPKAVELLSDALDRHRSHADVRGIAVCLFMLAQATSWLGDPRSANLGEELLALCEEKELSWFGTYALWVLGLEMFRQGNLPRATNLIQRSAKRRYAFHDQLGVALCIEVLAWIAGAENRHAQAAELFGAARVFWRAVGASPYKHLVAQHELYMTQAQESLSATAFDAAVSRGERLGPSDVISLALTEPPTAQDSATGSTPLTRREREVALLVAQGLSNREIATHLVIAQRTAESHVQNILVKLGFRSRTQLRPWAAEQLLQG